jgi:hypothetical protein
LVAALFAEQPQTFDHPVTTHGRHVAGLPTDLYAPDSDDRWTACAAEFLESRSDLARSDSCMSLEETSNLIQERLEITRDLDGDAKYRCGDFSHRPSFLFAL